jgi:hypothetical protein
MLPQRFPMYVQACIVVIDRSLPKLSHCAKSYNTSRHAALQTHVEKKDKYDKACVHVAIKAIHTANVICDLEHAHTANVIFDLEHAVNLQLTPKAAFSNIPSPSLTAPPLLAACL